MVLVLGVLLGVAAAGGLALMALRENVMFFFAPADVVAGKAPIEKRFRLGGMVKPGSVRRAAGSLEIDFVVTDFKHDVALHYRGVMPDLFRENQGVVAHGILNSHGQFIADEILAKHDENYMPPEVAAAIKRQHNGVMPALPNGT
jgi:cytochrome c-type biogenesis protein CcmE